MASKKTPAPRPRLTFRCESALAKCRRGFVMGSEEDPEHGFAKQLRKLGDDWYERARLRGTPWSPWRRVELEEDDLEARWYVVKSPKQRKGSR